MKVDRDLTNSSYGISGSHALLAEAIHIEAESYVSAYRELQDEGIPWTTPLEVRGVILATLMAAYLEALINLYLSFRMPPEQFSLIDSASPLEKWAAAPGLFIEGYGFDKSGSLYSDLKTLFSRRNQIVHMKPEVTRGRKLVHKGNSFKLSPQNHQFTLRWLKLPESLIEHLGKYDKSHEFKLFSMMSWRSKLSSEWERRLISRLNKTRLEE